MEVGPTVTGEYEELLLAVQLVLQNLGVGRDNLLLRLQSEVLLKLEVADGTRQCEVAWMLAGRIDATRTVYASKLYKAAGSSDTRSLLLVGRLVVVGHGLGLALVPENGPRVSRVGNDDAAVGGDNADNGSAARGIVEEGGVGAKVLVRLEEHLL